MLKNLAKNSSNQLKKTSLSSEERLAQSITGLAWGLLPGDGRSGRVNRTIGGGPGERLGKVGGKFGDRVGRGGARDGVGIAGLRVGVGGGGGGAGDEAEDNDGRL